MTVRRVPCVDEYVEGGESAVLSDDQVFVLSPLATTILAVIGEDAVDVTDIAVVLGESFGEPPDGTGLVVATTAAIRSLAEIGLVEMSRIGAT